MDSRGVVLIFLNVSGQIDGFSLATLGLCKYSIAVAYHLHQSIFILSYLLYKDVILTMSSSICAFFYFTRSYSLLCLSSSYKYYFVLALERTTV